jgi:hypothetical protein
LSSRGLLFDYYGISADLDDDAEDEDDEDEAAEKDENDKKDEKDESDKKVKSEQPEKKGKTRRTKKNSKQTVTMDIDLESGTDQGFASAAVSVTENNGQQVEGLFQRSSEKRVSEELTVNILVCRYACHKTKLTTFRRDDKIEDRRECASDSREQKRQRAQFG